MRDWLTMHAGEAIAEFMCEHGGTQVDRVHRDPEWWLMRCNAMPRLERVACAE